jgi:hypothetical protein
MTWINFFSDFRQRSTGLLTQPRSIRDIGGVATNATNIEAILSFLRKLPTPGSAQVQEFPPRWEFAERR